MARRISSSVNTKSYHRFVLRFVFITFPIIEISRGIRSGILPTRTRTATIARSVAALSLAEVHSSRAVNVQPSREELLKNSLLFKESFFLSVLESFPYSPEKTRQSSSLTLKIDDSSNM